MRSEAGTSARTFVTRRRPASPRTLRRPGPGMCTSCRRGASFTHAISQVDLELPRSGAQASFRSSGRIGSHWLEYSGKSRPRWCQFCTRSGWFP